MIALPDGLRLARTTPTFDERSVPAGLLSAHRIGEGVWGRLEVLAGAVDFVFEDEPDAVRRLEPGDHQVIPPSVAHHISIDDNARFHIEFHR